MSTEAERIAVEVLALPASVRAFLAHKLIASLEEDVDDGVERQWMDVVDRRSEDIAQGRVQCRPVAEVVREIRIKLDAQRRESP
ncbi:MAG: addiction module protein [Planctomycetes bacterium]|nr:addiction module protein [Planctomycetota bacterium]